MNRYIHTYEVEVEYENFWNKMNCLMGDRRGRSCFRWIFKDDVSWIASGNSSFFELGLLYPHWMLHFYWETSSLHLLFILEDHYALFLSCMILNFMLKDSPPLDIKVNFDKNPWTSLTFRSMNGLLRLFTWILAVQTEFEMSRRGEEELLCYIEILARALYNIKHAQLCINCSFL